MIRAMRDQVIVKVHYKEKIGSIFLPTDTAKKYDGDYYGEVVAIGKDYKYEVKVGDKVMFPRHEGKKITVNDEDYYVLKSRWVEGIIEEE